MGPSMEFLAWSPSVEVLAIRSVSPSMELRAWVLARILGIPLGAIYSESGY